MSDSDARQGRGPAIADRAESERALIEHLVADLRPVPRHALPRRLLLGLGLGLCGAVLVMLAVLGLRPDLGTAAQGPVLWLKLGYAGALAAAGFAALDRLARPLGGARAPVFAVLALLVLAAGLALANVISAPAEARHALIFGTTALVCPFLIALVGAPVLAALLAVLRRIEPTRPGLAGAAAGLVAGGAGTLVYALHCPETGLPFIALWYSAGIGLTAALGALAAVAGARWAAG
ncbi:DUF1109 domain-containing protein [Paracoccus aminophilus]|uniref:DUF1109 family protein n=1 Tax=Paracoccus aminophilus JCM 7686 TaxID=1367847 RepID=S5YHP1_PARAH|nr:DUF1109 domain-containing protein [Paracoccus aminophilus]AGT10983.1 hypothetical protein JCM7686_pAMI4p293 [Paracoccus aminophilus JCM 7686]